MNNQTQKTLIKNYVELSNDYTNETAFYITLKELQTVEQKEALKRIAKAFKIEIWRKI